MYLGQIMKRLIFSSFKKVTNALSGKGLGRIPGVISLHKLIYKMVKPKGVILIKCQGNKMFVNTEDEGIVPPLLIQGVYEKCETELFKKLIKPGMVVMDAGANIGYYTLIAAKLVGNNGRVYAFEPDPNNYKLLVKNIKTNGYTNIIPIQKALSNKNKKIKLFVDKVAWGNQSFSENNVPGKAGFVKVRTITLDDFSENVVNDKKIDLIKMDTQGAEGLIIEGAKKILRNSKSSLKITMEFWPYGLKNVGTDPLKLLRKLKSYGFKIKLIDEINECISDIEIMKIFEICENENAGRGFVNLLLEK